MLTYDKTNTYTVVDWVFVTPQNLYVETYEAQAWIKIAGRNIKNLRYTDDSTLMAESKEELKSLLMKAKVKRRVKKLP